ncbi:MAG: phosphate uptake regulator [Natronomonas sp.]|jgi:phosphate uptake regulator|uniref:PhoU domain-containing protein n=1 Tax=Natronomonas sp. TaxID=2184060 RepID=UPI00398943F9
MTQTTDHTSGPIERKVQVTGGSTYTVSIPKDWANARDIGSGSPVHLYPFDDRLVVAKPDNGFVRRAQINVEAAGTESLAEQIEAAYAAGADEIIIESDTGFDSSERRIASGAITSLVGVEIATETPERIAAQSLLDPSEVSLEGTIDQLRGISLSMHENAMRALTGADNDSEELARHVVSRDNDVDRLFALVSRQFYRALTDVREINKLGIDRRIALTRFRTARQLERVADHAELIADVAIRREAPPDPELGDRFEKIATDARRVVRTALDGNTGEALLRRDDVVDRLDDLDRELYTADREGTYLDGRVLESVRRTAEYGGNVAEIVALAGIANHP